MEDGGAQRWWLHHSLASLAADLEAHESRLILRRGESAETLGMLAAETGASGEHAIRHHGSWWTKTERRVSGRLELQLHDGNQLARRAMWPADRATAR